MTWAWTCHLCPQQDTAATRDLAAVSYHRHYTQHHDTTPTRYGTREDTP